MTIDQLYKIEKNKKFKRHICAKGIWKNYAFVPPSIVLFCGLFGLIYLFNQDKLISWNSIPFIIIFIIGTIWFKSARKYLINKRCEKITSIQICKAVTLDSNGKGNLLVFSSQNNRNNITFLENKFKKIDEDISIESLNLELDKPLPLEKEDLYVVKVKKKIEKNESIILINRSQILKLTEKEIIKYK